MKALFLVFHGFEAYNGISKKIHYQVDALKKCGVDARLCYFNIDDSQDHKRMVDDQVLEHYGAGIKAKINKRTRYDNLINYILENKIDFVYMRYDHNANPFLINMLKKLKKEKVKVVMEIPTYPYDQEYKGLSFSLQMQLFMDKCFRKRLAKHLQWIVTFSGFETIFGVPTINISNGIDFDHIKIKTNVNDTIHKIRLIGVADIHLWHGFDRVISGLAEYYKNNNPTVTVYFDIVGKGVPNIMDNLAQMVKDNKLDQYVIFHGAQWGDDLDNLFEAADMGIASLARHRSNITHIKTLKNREYAARGIPFIYSEIDDDFENTPYIIKAPANETPLNIQELVTFRNSEKFIPEAIRGSIINQLSWKSQMQKVIDIISNQ